MLEQSRQGERLDRCLWTGLNKAYGGRGNNSVLVGTPETIADSLMEYRRMASPACCCAGRTRSMTRP